MSDTRMLGPNRPAINYAERGALYLEIEVQGPEHDLHSGNFGGAIYNPLQALCEIVARLHDANGRISIPGLYAAVREWNERERADMAHAGPSDDRILEDAQTEFGWGERGYSLYERLTLRPALTINGITGGYQGPGGRRHPRPRCGKAQLSSRPRSGCTGSRAAFPEPHREDHAPGGALDRQNAVQRRPGCHRSAASSRPGGDARLPQRLWRGTRFPALRWHHSDPEHLPKLPRANCTQPWGLCPSRRSHSCAQRKIPYSKFLQAFLRPAFGSWRR